jgi:AcrR family transcriptional regulator
MLGCIAVSDPVKRTYRSSRRADAARQTRQLIRDAAARLFVEQGITATAMRQIAEAAGVAERTVYTVFPTKTALFHEIVDIATAGDELPIPVADRAAFTDVQLEADPARAVRLLVEFGVALLDRAGPLITAAIESSGADPDMRAWSDRAAAETTRNFRTVARSWNRAGLLREGLAPKAAAAILATLSSPHVHHILRHHHGWTSTQYRDWLIDTITRTVIRPI